MSAASVLEGQGHRELAVVVGGPSEWAAGTGRSLETGR
jgi:hydroxyacylglutathione hydrolase